MCKDGVYSTTINWLWLWPRLTLKTEASQPCTVHPEEPSFVEERDASIRFAELGIQS